MRILVLGAIGLAAIAVAAPSGWAADECRGLRACIPVAGPWVVLPAANGASSAQWRLECPEGVVGGLDARASEGAVSVTFSGLLGSPVNPGITTTRAVIFTGKYAGRTPKATTFRPFIGCIPSAGGRRIPVGLSAAPAVKPGDSITMRVKTLEVEVGELVRTTQRCLPDERLVRARYAVGLYTDAVPGRARLNSVQVVQAVRGRQVLVSATRRGLPPQVRAEVQIQAECAR
jgi:hypothetical protein